MAAVDSLRTHLIDELVDLLDAENQLTKALPKMASSATARPLKTAFQKHLGETRGHVTRLNQALRSLGEKPRRKTCEGMKGLLEEGNDVMKKAPAGAVRDAVMITAAQKVEHYEIASYGTARTYAQVLGENQVVRLLAKTLKEEKAADGKLTTIAEGSVNEDAAEEWESQSEDGVLGRSMAWLGSAIGTARRQMGGGAGRRSMDVAHERSTTRRRAQGRRTRRTSSSRSRRSRS